MQRIVESIERKPCTICGVWNGKIFSERDGVAVIRCKTCGLYYVDATPLSSLRQEVEERIATEEGYDYLNTIYKNRADQWTHYYQEKLRLIEKFNPRKRLLDIGCGVGFMVKVAHDSGWDAIGIDTSSDDIVFGQMELNLGNRLSSAGLEELYTQKPFDVITMFSVIEHIPDPYEFPCSLMRILRPGSIILIKTPSQDSLITLLHWILLKLSRGKIDTGLYNREHIYRFSRKTLSLLAEKTGYRVKEISYDDQLWITAARYRFNHKRSIFLKTAALALMNILGKILNRQNQILFILEYSTGSYE